MRAGYLGEYVVIVYAILSSCIEKGGAQDNEAELCETCLPVKIEGRGSWYPAPCACSLQSISLWRLCCDSYDLVMDWLSQVAFKLG